MLLKVSGKCTSFEVKAAHRNQKAQISFAELGKVGVGHRLDNGNPPSESTQSRKRYRLVLICILGSDRRFKFAIQSRLAKQRDLKELI